LWQSPAIGRAGRANFGSLDQTGSKTLILTVYLNVNVYIFIHEKHEIGSTITNSMVSVVLPWKTGFKYINGTYDMNMSKVLPI